MVYFQNFSDLECSRETEKVCYIYFSSNRFMHVRDCAGTKKMCVCVCACVCAHAKWAFLSVYLRTAFTLYQNAFK